MRVLTVLLVVLLFTIQAAAQTADITVKELEQHVYTLASDSLKGRKPGTEEDRLSANYIQDQIAFDNVHFLGDKGLQVFEIVSSVELGENNALTAADTTLVVGQDYIPFAFSENGRVEAPVAFVGYGFDIQTDSLTWNDYQNVDVTGKWVMVLRGEPEIDSTNSPFIPYSDLRKKVFVAKDHGAAGVLFVSGGYFDAEDDLPELLIKDSHITAGLPTLQLKKPMADRLVASRGVTVDSLEARLNATRLPFSFVTDQQVSATIDVQRVQKPTHNVVAVLPGLDPVLQHEYVILGAHYDHLGFGGPGSGSRRPDTTAIHNGADDNASGVAVAMEVFEKLAAQQQDLKRSVLFIAFAAEEMGTLGAKHFTENPLLDLDDATFMFNFDMVGRLDSTRELSLSGTGTAAGLEDLLTEVADPYKFKLGFSSEGLGPSDHAAFYAEDIPAVHFFTGVHDDYHTPADDPELLNYPGTKQVADYAFDLIWEMANRPEPLAFQLAGPQERSMSRRNFKVTLGIMPDVAGQETRGLRVDAVMPERPAFHAGMEKGDIIISMDGRPVKDVYEYMHRLSEFEVGQRISVEVIRGDETEILIVEL